MAPDTCWIDDETGEHVNAVTGHRTVDHPGPAYPVDLTPRYVPDAVYIVAGGRAGLAPVTGTTAHPPGHRPPGCPVTPDTTLPVVLQVHTGTGSRWFTCARAYINAELRMVAIGCNARDEVRMVWAPVPDDQR